jgi:hypothetical protein
MEQQGLLLGSSFRFDADPLGTGRGVEVQTSVQPGDRVRSAGGSLCDRLAAYFKARPDQWIDGRELGTVAGAYAWRSRVSELRRAPYDMAIENRQRRVGGFTVSEYRLPVPIAAKEEA